MRISSSTNIRVCASYRAGSNTVWIQCSISKASRALIRQNTHTLVSIARRTMPAKSKLVPRWDNDSQLIAALISSSRLISCILDWVALCCSCGSKTWNNARSEIRPILLSEHRSSPMRWHHVSFCGVWVNPKERAIAIKTISEILNGI